MDSVKIHESELRFCEVLWECEPINSSELCKRCAEVLGWKKSTVYTVIKRLCEKGVIKSENAVVTSLVSRDEAMLGECLGKISLTYGDVASFLRAYLESAAVSDADKAKVTDVLSAFGGRKKMPSYLL